MISFITILLCILGIVALAFVTKILNELEYPQEDGKGLIPEKENNLQGKLMLFFGVVFLVAVCWSFYQWIDVTLQEPASKEGEVIDSLMNTTWFFLIIVFFVTQPMVFYFAYRYRWKKGKKAKFITHNNKLELLWSAIPLVALSVLITFGLSTWNDIMYFDKEETEDYILVEVYGQQFNWTARYAGDDGQLGYANVQFVEGSNIMGIDPSDERGKDDIVVKELHLPKGKRVVFKFRSQDVIHSAYMPHFRAQMNCVPGMITQFSFVPTLTTEEYRALPSTHRKVKRVNKIREQWKKEGKDVDPWKFDYVLLCNKICGSTHYSMQMKIIVEEEDDFKEWLKSQTKFKDIK